MAHVPEIRIMRERCVRCGDCVEVCPQSGKETDFPVFVDSADGEEIIVAHEENCIACGTCVEFCRAAAILMSFDSRIPDSHPDIYPTRPANKII